MRNFFVPASSQITYYACGKQGHKAYNCDKRKFNNSKKVWVPKGTITNPKGSKMAWISKIKK